MGSSIYKYMASEHAARMLAEGTIRLGTLHTYRNEEELGPEVGDKDEGTVDLKKSGFTVVDTAGPRSIPAFFRDGLSVDPGSRLQIIARDGIGRRFEDPDCWIYCTSKHFDRDQMISMGYDTCIVSRSLTLSRSSSPCRGRSRQRFGPFGAQQSAYTAIVP